MNEKELMQWMHGIREDYITDAVNWNGGERKRTSQIRRLSVGVGATAAAIAVAVGGIAYGVRRGGPQTQPGSSLSADAATNLLGGAGELKFRSEYCGSTCIYMRDDQYYYVHDRSKNEVVRWPLTGGAGEPVSFSITGVLLTDNERLYTAENNVIEVLGSDGTRTPFCTISPEWLVREAERQTDENGCTGWNGVEAYQDSLTAENIQAEGIRRLSGSRYQIDLSFRKNGGESENLGYAHLLYDADTGDMHGLPFVTGAIDDGTGKGFYQIGYLHEEASDTWDMHAALYSYEDTSELQTVEIPYTSDSSCMMMWDENTMTVRDGSIYMLGSDLEPDPEFLEYIGQYIMRVQPETGDAAKIYPNADAFSGQFTVLYNLTDDPDEAYYIADENGTARFVRGDLDLAKTCETVYTLDSAQLYGSSTGWRESLAKYEPHIPVILDDCLLYYLPGQTLNGEQIAVVNLNNKDVTYLMAPDAEEVSDPDSASSLSDDFTEVQPTKQAGFINPLKGSGPLRKRSLGGLEDNDYYYYCLDETTIRCFPKDGASEPEDITMTDVFYNDLYKTFWWGDADDIVGRVTDDQKYLIVARCSGEILAEIENSAGFSAFTDLRMTDDDTVWLTRLADNYHDDEELWRYQISEGKLEQIRLPIDPETELISGCLKQDPETGTIWMGVAKKDGNSAKDVLVLMKGWQEPFRMHVTDNPAAYSIPANNKLYFMDYQTDEATGDATSTVWMEFDPVTKTSAKVSDADFIGMYGSEMLGYNQNGWYYTTDRNQTVTMWDVHTGSTRVVWENPKDEAPDSICFEKKGLVVTYGADTKTAAYDPFADA